MGVIKGVLREELKNSLRMLNSYKKALKEAPGGCLVRKNIRGHMYYYLAIREGARVKFIYKGKKFSKEEMNKLSESKKLRGKYKKLIQKLNQRIRYLNKVLHGKEDV